MQLGACYRQMRDLLRASASETPDLDARILTGAALEIAPNEIFLREDDEVSAEAEAQLRAFVAERCAGKPVGRILGHREFWGLDFLLSPATLEPRPDTETLVEVALDLLAPMNFPVIADLGTGTGAIAVALLSEREDLTAIAVDLSEEALRTARQNATRHEVAARMPVVQASYASALGDGLDGIVSNPPYIDSSDIATLARDVRDFDPVLALDGGADGLDAYRVITRESASCLKAGGFLAVEIGATQGPDVMDLFRAEGFTKVRIIYDLSNKARVVTGSLPF